MIDAVGLEDCTELVAQATPAQLSHIFDLDLWRPSSPGLDERFDADRFGVWLEVLVDAGEEIAAAKLAGMPLEQLVAGLAQHTRVFDIGALVAFETTDGEIWDYSRPAQNHAGVDVGGYRVIARREDAWDAIVAVVTALEAHHADRFHELMRAVRARSHARREEDGFHSLLDHHEQMMFDVAADRERRRQERGFASPADARAFLQMSRSVTPESMRPKPIARAYARSIEMSQPEDEAPVEPAAEEMTEVAALLADAGVTPLAAPRALPGSGEVDPTSRLERAMRIVFERDQIACGERHFELAYLANVLRSGCSIQGRPFTTKEAADGAVAICNLGLERMHANDDCLITNDLIGAFQIGWTVLYRDACVYSVESLAATLAAVRVDDDELQSALNLLRVRLMRELANGTPWKASSALDVLTSIDMPAWAALVALIAECPVIHAGLTASVDRGVRTVDANEFAFIATPGQLESIRGFMMVLPALLR